MVLWTRLAVIVVLSYSTTFAKVENDLQRIAPISIEQMQQGILKYCAAVPGCRFSKVMLALRDNVNINAEGSSSSSNYNLKVKNRKSELADNLDGNDSAEEDMPMDNLEGNDNFLNSYDELDIFKAEEMKRGHNLPTTGCDCRVTNELLDLGHLYYPRYLLNAVCQKYDESFEYPSKCWRGAQCRPLEYKVRVLTHRSHNDHLQKDPTTSLLPETLRSLWKFKTVTVAAGCFCS